MIPSNTLTLTWHVCQCDQQGQSRDCTGTFCEMSRTARIYNRWLAVGVGSVSKTLSSHHAQVVGTSCSTGVSEWTKCNPPKYIERRPTCYNCDPDRKIGGQFVKSFEGMDDDFLAQMLALRSTTTRVYQRHRSPKARALLEEKES